MHAHQSAPPIPRRGVTLIEVVVSVSVLGLLAALISAALVATREASRTSTCGNHLHQISVAFANAEAVHGEYPTRHRSDLSMWPLLPYLEQRDLYEGLVKSELRSAPPVVELFLCPGDSQSTMIPGDINYFPNLGTRFRFSADWNGFALSRFGPGHRQSVQSREITDGLSQTAAMSERLVVTLAVNAVNPRVTDDALRNDPRRYLWHTDTRHARAGDESQATSHCRAGMTTPSPFESGLWGITWNPESGYDHLLPPNHRACYNDVAGDGANSLSDARLIPPSSVHPGGVNLLLADGRVTFVNETIGAGVWHAIGTRAGGEVEVLR